MNLVTTLVMPEFLNDDQLIDGERYVLAELSHDARLNIYNEHPRYMAETDSWVFKRGMRKKDDEDCWLPERRYIELATARGLHL